MLAESINFAGGRVESMETPEPQVRAPQSSGGYRAVPAPQAVSNVPAGAGMGAATRPAGGSLLRRETPPPAPAMGAANAGSDRQSLRDRLLKPNAPR